MEESKKKSDKKNEHGVPQLVDKSSDFHGWYSRLQLKLDAKGLWEDFCARPEMVPDKDKEKDKYEKHLQRRKEARWRIEKTLSMELSKTVHDVEQPYDLLTRLRKMFVGATKLTLVHQLRSIMLMKYKKGKNLLTFIEDLKDGFTKLDNMGILIEDKLKPYVLVMVLDDAFDDILRPYLVHTLAGNVELNFDKIVELLESSYIEGERRQQLNLQDTQKEGETALAVSGKPKRSGKCNHCGIIQSIRI
jgi:hypothetical protein